MTARVSGRTVGATSIPADDEYHVRAQAAAVGGQAVKGLLDQVANVVFHGRLGCLGSVEN